MKPMLLTLVWNRLEHTKWCFSQIEKFAGPRDSYYWVVVENNSQDGTREYIQRRQADFDKVIYNEFNIGMVHGRNVGLAQREPSQDVLHLQGDQDFQGSEDFVKCFQNVVEKIREGDQAPGMICGDYANWYDNREQYAPAYFAANEASGNTFWSKACDPPKRSQPVDQRGVWLPGDMLDAVGYWCELTLQSDLEMPYRVANAGFVNWGTRALVWNLERYHSVGFHPVSAHKSARSFRRSRGFVMQNSLGFDHYISEEVFQKKNCYRASIWDPESLKKWNPHIVAPRKDKRLTWDGTIIPENREGTYREWSGCHLEWFKKFCQDDTKSLEQQSMTPTQVPPGCNIPLNRRKSNDK